MTLPADAYAHRRGDGEIVGWIMADGAGYRAIDLLGRAVGAPPMEWLDAEDALEQRGIGYLADRYVLTRADGSDVPVRIAEADTRSIVVVEDEFGAASAVGATPVRHVLPFPAPETLTRAN